MSPEEIADRIAARIRLADADPEAGHGYIDYIVESVLRDAAKGEDVRQKAAMVVELLDHEEAVNWRRWYA